MGGSNCIFADETLSQMIPNTKTLAVPMAHQTTLEVYDIAFDPGDYYLIGVDTASSVSGCYNAIEIFSYRDFKQMAELKIRLGSLTKYGDIVDGVFQWLYKMVKHKILLCVENNSIGKSIIEHLIYHCPEFNYIPFMFKEKDKDQYGINTNGKTKDMMVSFFYELVTEDPKVLRSADLIAQLHTIERTNAGTVSSSSFSDLFMAGCMAAYGRKQTLLEIMPSISLTSKELETALMKNVQVMAQMIDPKTAIKKSSSPFSPNVFTNEVEMMFDTTFDSQKDSSSDELPFFFGA